MSVEFVDADAHVVEAELVPECLKRWPHSFTLGGEGNREVLTEGRRYPEWQGPGAGCPPEHGLSRAQGINPFTPGGTLADADRDGIDHMVFYPSFGLRTPSIEDRKVGVRVRAALQRVDRRLVPARQGALSRRRRAARSSTSATRSRRCARARDLGLVCGMIPPALKTRNLDHPDLDPLYAAATELDMPLGVHGAPGIHLPKIGVDRFDNYIQVHCISFPFDQMTAMTALVSGGVFDRHPKLRVAFLEAGVGWVPYFVDRMHEHYEKRGDWIPNGWKRDPRRVHRGRQRVGQLRAGGAHPAGGRADPGAGLHHVRQRLPALGRRLAGEHQAPAPSRRHRRRRPRQDRRRQRSPLLRPDSVTP